MLDQLTKSLEPLLMTYGIWVALFFAVMVLIPVGIVIWMQKRHQHEEHEQLSEHFQALAAFQQQLTGIETMLTQYQQQAARFGTETREQAAEVLKQQDDCLARVLRLKSELRETEARLPQLGDQLLSRLEDAESQLEGLKAYFEQIETWYKQLHQGVADSRTQLHQLQATLQAQKTRTPAENEKLQGHWEQLRFLQAETSPADPLQYQQAIQRLQQAIESLRKHIVSTPSEAPAEAIPLAAAASEPLVEAVLPAPADSFALDDLPEAPSEAPAPVAEAETGGQALDPSPSSTSTGSFKLSQLPPEVVQALRQGMLTQPAAVPDTDGIPDTEASPEAETITETEPVAERSDIDSLFDHADFDDFLAEGVVTETFMGQRGEEPAEEVVPHQMQEEPGSDDAGPEPLVEESVVIDTFLGQQIPEPEADTSDEALPEEASDDVVEEPAQAEDDSLLAESDSAAETDEPQAESLDESQDEESDADDAEQVTIESAPFLAARSRLAQLDDELADVEMQYRELETAFVPEAWPESLIVLDRCRYLAAEAQEMLLLARRLQHLPQAPGHRVQLNLRRLQSKCQQVEETRELLQQTLSKLDDETGSLKERLINATEQLQELREQVDTDWLQQQAGRLKDVRLAMERRPFHLPACRQQIRQVEIEIDTMAQP